MFDLVLKLLLIIYFILVVVSELGGFGLIGGLLITILSLLLAEIFFCLLRVFLRGKRATIIILIFLVFLLKTRLRL